MPEVCAAANQTTTWPMQRRAMLRVLGSATALAVLPSDAAAAWARVASGLRPVGGLSDDQLALIGLLADTVIPRTDTPSASDVQVPAFVNVIVSENNDDAERSEEHTSELQSH